MLKKLLIPFFVLLASAANAQLNNQWIDYAKTYYKFKVSRDTLCRIPQTALSGLGLGSVPAEQFQLWRNGQEVRLYTTVSTGAMGASDYIEFWGQMNDGKPDNQLYLNPDYQISDRYSLENDTSSYFLTVNPAGPNLRYTDVANPSPGSGTPDAYFMRNIDVYYKSQVNRGRAEVVGEYIYSSSYDKGEGWSSNTVATTADLAREFFNLNAYMAGPANGLTVRVNAAGSAPNLRTVRIKLFNNDITGAPWGSPINMSLFEYQKINIPNLPLSLLAANPNYLIMYVGDVSTATTDRLVVASLGITYPATFNFNAQRNFSFSLAPSASGNYLEISNFNYGAVAPVLYDITSGTRYTGDISSNPGKVRFVLPASSAPERKFLLAGQELYQPINSFVQRNFTDYSQPSNQGDYIIISNPALYNDGSGNNYVEQYRAYRSSVAGGEYNAKVYDINELYDQFAFGIPHHPGSIRDFARFATSNFAVRPRYVFLIGRGMDYVDQKSHETDPISAQLNLVPTFGWPASDGMLVATPGTFLPTIPIGRLGAINGTEVNHYLQKVIQYEQQQQSSSPLIADKLWMKNFMFIVGGKDSGENGQFETYTSNYADIVRDTLMGGYAETFTKSSTGAVQQANSDRIEQLFDNGLGWIGYFGHSSANTFEFNLSNPDIYTNTGKYPFFNVSGCSAGNFFIYDPTRLGGNLSLSEKYVLANQRGSIGFLADTHFGIPQILDPYNVNLYKAVCRTMYGNTIGNQIVNTIQNMGGSDPNLNFYTRIHVEELTLHGDPAIKVNTFEKPDYVIEDPDVKLSPNIISVADANFSIDIKMRNIGRATNDSIRVWVKRKLPNDTIRVLIDSIIPAIRNTDSFHLVVPIVPTTDKGLNQLMITLDATNRVDELYETNNYLSRDFYIFEDELRPTSPYNFSIVNQQNITYVGNTADPLSGQRNYLMEIDTTELFNSPWKKSYNQSGPGGIVEFTPTNITFTDSTVYYWRVAMQPTGSSSLIWNSFSFIYLPNSSTGFNQSHYFQHLKSSYTNITLDADRKFRFEELPRNLIIRTGLYPTFLYDRINVNLDATQLELYGCKYNSIQVYVFDSTTLIPWRNNNTGSGSTAPGQYGSFHVCQNTATPTDPSRAFFEFPYTDAVHRKAAIDFLTDSIPAGKYVAITNLGMASNSSFISQWQADQATLGAGHSLYHTLHDIGFTKIDSFYHNLPFLFFYQKGISSFTPRQVMGDSAQAYIDETFTLKSISDDGAIKSAQYGPARSWTSMHWRGFSVDADPTIDSVAIQVWGVKSNGVADSLTTVVFAQDTTLNFVDANVYPYLRLVMLNSDKVNITPQQLRYLRVNANLVPEGAVAPGLLFKLKDSVVQGEPLEFQVAFKNISQVAFDSLIKVKLYVKDRTNTDHILPVPKRKALPMGDTLALVYTIDTKDLPGINTLGVDFNPDNDQPEQYHYNNVLFKNFYVQEDKFDPLLDVTFDGVHILNRDIVSAKPHILIKLKDESRYLELKDTASIKLQVRYPDQSLHTYYFGDTMRFTPANLATGQNTASIDFSPSFLSQDQSEEGEEYELIVTGKDVTGNKAGQLDYHIIFKVINKPMISNLFNYPNPFTTSTAFVFTVTGSEVPNMRIQILTITGKVVKEIPRSELGNVHIGNNITDYKWDGTDMYGQKLANGVYIYRVISSLNGKKMEKYQTFYNNGKNTNSLFNKGYGKMYLMR